MGKCAEWTRFLLAFGVFEKYREFYYFCFTSSFLLLNQHRRLCFSIFIVDVRRSTTRSSITAFGHVLCPCLGPPSTIRIQFGGHCSILDVEHDRYQPPPFPLLLLPIPRHPPIPSSPPPPPPPSPPITPSPSLLLPYPPSSLSLRLCPPRPHEK